MTATNIVIHADNGDFDLTELKSGLILLKSNTLSAIEFVNFPSQVTLQAFGGFAPNTICRLNGVAKHAVKAGKAEGTFIFNSAVCPLPVPQTAERCSGYSISLELLNLKGETVGPTSADWFIILAWVKGNPRL